MYKIEYAKAAFESLERISKSDRKLFSRIIHAIKNLALDPSKGKSLRSELKGRWSLRVGSYRVVYLFTKQKLIVYIIDVGHRKDVYKKKI